MDKIPLPTDNIFKFYALFGLLMLIFVMGATLVQNRTTNTRIYNLAVELEAVREADASKHPSLRAQMLEKLLEVEKSDKRFITTALSVVAGMGLLLMFFGFRRWHRDVQPLQDEMFRLQLEKLRRELAELPEGKPVPDESAQSSTQSAHPGATA